MQSAQSGDTITLLDNIALDARMDFPEGKDINLNLNNFTITINAGYILINDATTSVSIYGGKIVQTRAWFNGPAVRANKARNFELNNVIIEAESIYGFLNYTTGTTSVTNCNITAKVYPIYNMSVGNSIISDCVINTGRETSYNDSTGTTQTVSPNGIRDVSTGEVTISNCQITSAKVGIIVGTKNTTDSTDYTTKIIGGSITADDTCIELQTKSKTLISNVQLNSHVEEGASNKSYGMYMAATCTGEITVDGCTIANMRHGIYNYSGAKTTINNCNITNFDATGIFIKTGAETVVSNSTISTDKTVVETVAGISNFGRGEGTVAGKVLIDNCNITCPAFGITGNGDVSSADHVGKENTDITVTNSNINAVVGIYHPQQGTLEINGGSINASIVGVEVRAGTVTLNKNAVITVPSTVEYKSGASLNGEGTTVEGAALAISQHNTNKPIKVVVNEATLSAQKSLAQVDVETISETLSPVEVTVQDGTFNGGIVSNRVTEFINGGSFDTKPLDEYVHTKSVMIKDENNNYVVTSDVQQAKTEAVEYLKLYASTKNIAYTEEIDSMINSVDVYTLVGVSNAKKAAIERIDQMAETLLQAKKDAIAEIKLAAEAKEATATEEAQEAVVVPTATYSAINTAFDAQQVEEFKLNALAEIADIRKYRKQITKLSSDAEAVLQDIAEFQSTLLGDTPNTGRLAETQTALKEYLDVVKSEINTYSLNQLAIARSELNTSISNAKNQLNTSIDEVKGSVNDSASDLDTVGKDVTAIKDKKPADMTAIYAMLAVSIVISISSLAVVLVMLLKKKKV